MQRWPPSTLSLCSAIKVYQSRWSRVAGGNWLWSTRHNGKWTTFCLSSEQKRACLLNQTTKNQHHPPPQAHIESTQNDKKTPKANSRIVVRRSFKLHNQIESVPGMGMKTKRDQHQQKKSFGVVSNIQTMEEWILSRSGSKLAWGVEIGPVTVGTTFGEVEKRGKKSRVSNGFSRGVLIKEK